MHQVPSIALNHKAFRIAELLVLFFVLGFLLYHFGSSTDEDFVSRSLQDSSHCWVFFVSTYILIRLLEIILYSHSLSHGSLATIALALAFSTGITIELVQPYLGRSASFLDIWYDLLGSGAATLAYLAFKTRLSSRKKIAMLLAAFALLALSSVLPLYYLQVQNSRADLFPILFDFEAAWQKELIHTSANNHLAFVRAPKDWPENTSHVARLDLSKETKYPGIHFEHMEKDWNSYDYLALEIFSKSPQQQAVTLRIDDADHNQQYSDRFNQAFTIQGGLNRFRIALDDVRLAPKGRKLQLQKINSMALFAIEPESPFTLYIDNIRLQ